MSYLDLLLRWIHILAAIVFVGGTIFWRWTLLPALESLPESSRQNLQNSLRQRWSRWVMLTSGLLLISGLINAVLAIQRYKFDGSLYHILVTVKLLLALAIFWIASTLAGRTAAAERLRQRSRFWLDVSVAIAVVLVCVAGVMKMIDRTPKPADEPPAAAQNTATESLLTVITSMDKKIKKKIDVLQQRLQKLRRQLAGAKKQADDPDEPGRLQSQIATMEAEVAELKAS